MWLDSPKLAARLTHPRQKSHWDRPLILGLQHAFQAAPLDPAATAPAPSKVPGLPSSLLLAWRKLRSCHYRPPMQNRESYFHNKLLPT
jgi:hypothetical protein